MEDFFVVSMGGSGSAVANALIFLTAAGVFGDRAKHIHLLIIDAHASHKGTLSAKSNADLYRDLKKYFNENNGYESFKPKITAYTWDLMVGYKGTKTKRDKFALRDLARIDKDGRDLDEYDSSIDKADILMKVLYTEHEQNQAVLTGFHAHPAIGAACGTAAVLSDSGSGFGEYVKVLQNQLTIGDAKMVLIGSLFGGTGASSLSSMVRAFYNAGNITGAVGKLSIAGIFLLPYFSFKKPSETLKPEEEIRPEMFNFGSKNALTYYDEAQLLKKNGNDQDGLFDAIYLLGFDKPIPRSAYSDGDGMNNPASFVEMEAAMAIRDFFIERELESSDSDRTFFKAIRRYSRDGMKFYKLEWETFTWGTELRDRIGKTLKMALLFNMYLFPNFFKRNGGPIKSAFKPWECYVQGNGDASSACDKLREFYLKFEKWCVDIAETLGDDVTKSDMFDLSRLRNLLNFQQNTDNKGKIDESIDLLKDCDKAKEAFINGYGRNDFVRTATNIINSSKAEPENKLAELLKLIYTQTKLEG
jgi:hypothetical protein